MQVILKFTTGRYMLQISTFHGELVNGVFFQRFYHEKFSKDVIIH